MASLRRASLCHPTTAAYGVVEKQPNALSRATVLPMHRELLAVILLTGCSGSGSAATTMTAASSSGTSGDTSAAGTACSWPADLYDGGRGSCVVGRALMQCQYPVGVECEGGASAASGGVTQTCISDSTTSCSGCVSSSGAATCTDQCGSNEYAVSCGGLLVPPLPDGGTVAWTYQAAPTGCIFAGANPGGISYYCCPCQ